MTQSNGSQISAVHAEASPSQSRVLFAEDLRKAYGSRVALRGLSFSLQAGRVLGFLGPNGAGKTTAIRILTTILEPSSGYFFVDGISSDYPERIRHRIGVLPESLGFAKHITGIECLTFFGRLYGRSAIDAKRYALTLLEEVGLQHRATSLIGTYSRGMRQRLGIARALINDPVVVFLDEPTLGLDPRGQQELLALVQRIARERSAGVILCSHLLSEIEHVCDDVVILSAGQVVVAGSVAEIIGQAQSNALQQNVIQIDVAPPSAEQAQHILEALPQVASVTPASGVAGWLRVELVPPADGESAGQHRLKSGVLEALVRADIPILRFESEGNRLQDVFLQLTEGTIG